MKNNLLILIPPSEGKTAGGTGKPLKKAPKEVQQMIQDLQNYEGDREKLLGVKGKALEAAIEANKTLLSSPTLPAIERYSGVVYSGIDYPTLSKKGQKYFNDHVRIISAVFGLVAPQDLLPDYKLKIEKLNAQKYWLPILSEKIKGSYVLDLLPKTHQKAIHYDKGEIVSFSIIKKGKKIPAGHNGKFIKGRFIRWLSEEGITDPKKITSFEEDGFKWNGEEFIKKTS